MNPSVYRIKKRGVLMSKGKLGIEMKKILSALKIAKVALSIALPFFFTLV